MQCCDNESTLPDVLMDLCLHRHMNVAAYSRQKLGHSTTCQKPLGPYDVFNTSSSYITVRWAFQPYVLSFNYSHAEIHWSILDLLTMVNVVVACVATFSHKNYSK